jgi:imidazolonepropionase-like amidohydrolase
VNKILLYTLLLVLFSLNPSMAQPVDVYIKAGHLYDSEQKVLLKNKIIQLRGTTIVAISDWNSIPKNTKIIDLSDYTVLPGLIDAHTHVLFSQTPVDDFAEHSIQTLVMEGDALRALRGAKRAKAYLDVGITSIKDLGNSGLFLDVALRDAIDEGSIAGPRIFASGPIIAAAGGQIYGVPSKQQHIIAQEYRIIKSVEDARNAVREHVNQNVDLIKICADNLPNRTLLSLDEMKAIVQTAHEYNLTVTAHAVTNQSAWNAITAGVDGIEHGFNIADTTLALMAQKKVFLVPTENSRTYMENYAKMVGMGDDEVDWIDYYMENMTKRLQSALEKGVPVLAGSDNYMDVGVSRGVSSRDMFRFYFEAGMKPLDILHAATYLSAVHLNKEKEIGNLIPQAKADIIAVKGDVEGDFLNTLENLVFVMKDGEVYLDKTE